MSFLISCGLFIRRSAFIKIHRNTVDSFMSPFVQINKREFHKKKSNQENDNSFNFLKRNKIQGEQKDQKAITEKDKEKENEKDKEKEVEIEIEVGEGKELVIENITEMKRRDLYQKENINIEVLNEELKDIETKMNKIRIIKKKGELKEKKKEITISHSKYPSQKYYKATEEEIELLKKSEKEFYLPIECENSTIIRLINIKDKISSPLFRCVRNSRIGLRKKERKFYLFYSSFICTFFFLMGVWQYKKVEKKKFLINYIVQNLNEPILIIDEFDFPWFTDYVSLKEKIEILKNDFLKWKQENEAMRTFSLLEEWNGFKEKLFSHQFNIAWKIKAEKNKKKNVERENKEAIERVNPKSKSKSKSMSKINISDFSCVSEWIERVRNENMFFKVIRKIIKKEKEITEEDLKKVVIEKYKYRKVEVSGVLDTSNEFYVGPKSIESKRDKIYYYVICPLYLKNGKAILINRGLLPDYVVNEKKQKQELPKMVTIRGILDPGELYESSFKKIKNFSNKSKYANYFFYYEPTEICHYSNLSNFTGASYFILNVHDIIYHEDLLDLNEYSSMNTNKRTNEDNAHIHENLKHLPGISLEDIDRESKERIKKLLQYEDGTFYKHHEKKKFENVNYNSSIGFSNNNSSDHNSNMKPFRYEQHFIHKRKKDYLKFFADENTHFNYACQWFLFSFLFSAISIFKFMQFKRWVY